MRTIALLGFSPDTRDLIDGVKDDVEIWSVNWAYRFLPPRIDRLFDVHRREILTTEKIEDYQKHWAWLQQEHDYPIYMIEEFPEVPNSVIYPIEEISKDVFGNMDGDYWTSGVAYMLGMAIHEQVDRIELYGIEMKGDTDVAYQKDGVAILSGIAMGRDIEVWRPEQSSLFRAARYGFEGGQMVPSRIVNDHLEHYKFEKEQTLNETNKMHGIVEERGRNLEKEQNEKRREEVQEEFNHAVQKLGDLRVRILMLEGAEQVLANLLAVADLEEPNFQLESRLRDQEMQPV